MTVNQGQPIPANTERQFPLETLRAYAEQYNIPNSLGMNEEVLMTAVGTANFQRTILHQGQLDGVATQISGHQRLIASQQGDISQLGGEVQALERQMRALSCNIYIYGCGLLLGLGLPIIVSLAKTYFSAQVPNAMPTIPFNVTQYVLTPEEEEELLASLR